MRLRDLLFLAALAAAGEAQAVANSYAVEREPEAAAAPATLRVGPGNDRASDVRLDADEVLASRIKGLKLSNSASTNKVLQIGVGREVPQTPEAGSAALHWDVVEGGRAAQWRVTSSGAHALRIGLEISLLPPGAEMRFSGEDGIGTVYGPFTAAELFAMGPTYWSPVLEGDTAIVEVFVPDGGAPAQVAMAISHVSHLVASPREANIDTLAKTAQVCEVNVICKSTTDAALATVAKSVARMTFVVGSSTYLCTGTLLNPRSGALQPYFYSATHCISTQAVASTLTTHWFYDSTACATDSLSPAYRQLAGGATLLFTNAVSDALLLRLNGTPPAGAVYAGWDQATLTLGIAVKAVHHPAGDLKKVSLGTFSGFRDYGLTTGSNHVLVTWDSVQTGVTEGGSSGSGIFTAVGQPAAEYRLRGGLHGGTSSCTATGPDLSDYYSRFDQAYPSIALYLDPVPCSVTLSSSSISIGTAAFSGSFAVTASCAWTASSNASWLTTNSSGNGSGTVVFNVAANTGAARSGVVSVNGQTFIVTQAAAPYALSLSKSGTGSGTIASSPAGIDCGATCTASYDFGTDVTLTAVAAGGSAFIGWNGACSGTGVCQVSISGATSVGAVFDLDPPRLANISTRGRVLTGADVMIGGFIIGGSSPKKVVIRAIGPSLTPLGVPGALGDPLLQIFSGQTQIAANDNWQQAANASTIQAIGFAPSNPLESAVLMTLNPGAYTAIVTGVGGGTGVGLVEVFEIDALTVPLINISTRGRVLTGADVMIGGFIIQGSGPQTVVVRARGPSLTALGLPGALANPTLSLYTGQTLIATNDDFGTAPNLAQLNASGFVPSNPLESAIYITLNPGAYTAIVSGAGGTTGVGIVEVFAVP